jgi:hypothetical protein
MHEFDRAFHEDEDGSYRSANVRLIRYADDFVIMARYIGPVMQLWVVQRLEADLGLRVNREKTGIVRKSDVRQHCPGMVCGSRVRRNVRSLGSWDH